MNAYYFIMNKNLLGKLRGTGDNFHVSVIELRDNEALLKVTNGLDSNMYMAEAVISMDYNAIKIRDGLPNTAVTCYHGFMLP